MKRIPWIVLLAFALFAMASAQQRGDDSAASSNDSEVKPVAADSTAIPRGANVFVAPMPDSFDDFLKEAIKSKKVPVTLVDSRDEAEFEITGSSESKKAGAAKVIILGSWHSAESASMKVENLKSGIIAFAYSYNTSNSMHGKKSSAEACAKHLKEKIEKGK